MKIIGLTGGIGAGKSTVTNYLQSKGFHVLDADRIARELVLPGSEALIEITAAFGEDMLLEDGGLNRKKLGQVVFHDPEKTKLLDGIMRDKILEILYDQIVRFREQGESAASLADPEERFRNQVVFIDAPLLFESGLDQLTHENWVVDADDETRIARVMERDALSREEIEDRIRRQMQREEKLRRAQEVLDNSGIVAELYERIDSLLARLKEEK